MMDPVLLQTATLEYALVLLNEKYSGKRQSMIEDKEERRKNNINCRRECHQVCCRICGNEDEGNVFEQRDDGHSRVFA